MDEENSRRELSRFEEPAQSPGKLARNREKRTNMSALNPMNSGSLDVDDELIRSLEAFEGSIDDGATSIDLPRMTVLQAMSPQLKKGGEQYIRATEVGDFCLIGSDLADHFKNGVAAIFCDYRTHHVVWPKERGASLPRNYFEDSMAALRRFQSRGPVARAL